MDAVRGRLGSQRQLAGLPPLHLDQPGSATRDGDHGERGSAVARAGRRQGVLRAPRPFLLRPVIAMRRIIVAGLSALALLSAAACGGGSSTTTDEVSYTIAQPFTALVIGARAAAIEIVTGAGPATVKETYTYSKDKPGTAHQVQGGTLRLTESGCVDDDA